MSVKWLNRLKRQLVNSFVVIHISRSPFLSLSLLSSHSKLYRLLTVDMMLYSSPT
ncbi:hypothetical protein C5167_045409 [Papaver somniferum]|uniref:Uncharacterized protein n=1 Tax=Papaver somniferum TaxID=3469 RepID=A0A4Y7LBK9_PAPSO|nr:hypothetical protein C5167_045409 [Papaver somniferum]